MGQNSENIIQSSGEISQSKNLSAKLAEKSAKLKFISQTSGEISQNKKISAKLAEKSAKIKKYQPN